VVDLLREFLGPHRQLPEATGELSDSSISLIPNKTRTLKRGDGADTNKWLPKKQAFSGTGGTIDKFDSDDSNI
jgi:hypothetical protein